MGARNNFDQIKMLAAEINVSSSESPDGRFIYIGYDKTSIFDGETRHLSQKYTFSNREIDQETENFVLVYSVDDDELVIFDDEASTFFSTVQWDLSSGFMVMNSGTSHLTRVLDIYDLATGVCTTISYMYAVNRHHEFGYIYSNELDLFAFRYPMMVRGDDSSFDPGFHTPDMYGIGIVVFNSSGKEVARYKSNLPDKLEIVSFTSTLTYRNISDNEVVECSF